MNNQRGDTIIEVILACAILALVTVSSFTIIERASASAYDALERSEVRLSINSQIELLNYFRDSYVKAIADGQAVIATGNNPADMWLRISNNVSTNIEPDLTTCSAPSDSFYIERDTGISAYRVVETPAAASTGLPSPGEGLWIKKFHPNGQSPNRHYHDFYVVACWPTTTAGEQRMSSIVRLHDPAL